MSRSQRHTSPAHREPASPLLPPDDMRAEVVDVLEHLVRIDSTNPPGNERAMAIEVGRLLRERGIANEVDVFDVERANVIARLPASSSDRGALIFSGHLDTVPAGDSSWTLPPLGLQRDGDVIRGLGASDMKGGLAAIIVAIGRVAAAGVPLRGDVVLAFTAGEEVDSVGARRFSRTLNPRDVLGMIVAEPTDNRLMVAEKGALWLRVRVRGATSHAARPELGRNAVMAMHGFIGRVTRSPLPHVPHDLLGSSTLTVTTLHGGSKTNVVPDTCEATIDIRTVPGQRHDEIAAWARAELEAVVAPLGRFETDVVVVNDRPSVATSDDDPFVLEARTVLRDVGGSQARDGFWAYTDASVYAFDHPGLPFAVCGPGRLDQCHRPDEFALASELEFGARFYHQLVVRLLMGKPPIRPRHSAFLS